MRDAALLAGDADDLAVVDLGGASANDFSNQWSANGSLLNAGANRLFEVQEKRLDQSPRWSRCERSRRRCRAGRPSGQRACDGPRRGLARNPPPTWRFDLGRRAVVVLDAPAADCLASAGTRRRTARRAGGARAALPSPQPGGGGGVGPPIELGVVRAQAAHRERLAGSTSRVSSTAAAVSNRSTVRIAPRACRAGSSPARIDAACSSLRSSSSARSGGAPRGGPRLRTRGSDADGATTTSPSASSERNRRLAWPESRPRRERSRQARSAEPEVAEHPGLSQRPVAREEPVVEGSDALSDRAAEAAELLHHGRIGGHSLILVRDLGEGWKVHARRIRLLQLVRHIAALTAQAADQPHESL